MYVSEPKITALEPIGQLRVVEAEQVQDRGVQVVNVDRVFRRVPADLVARPDHLAAPPPAIHMLKAPGW